MRQSRTSGSVGDPGGNPRVDPTFTLSDRACDQFNTLNSAMAHQCVVVVAAAFSVTRTYRAVCGGNLTTTTCAEPVPLATGLPQVEPSADTVTSQPRK